MSERFICVESFHPILGENVQVKDTKKGVLATIFTGPNAWERAQERAAELEKEEACSPSP